MAADKRSSQWNESLVSFSVKIILSERKLSVEIFIDTAEYRGKAAFTWRRASSQPRVLLCEVITTHEEVSYPYTAERIAREEAVHLFWAEQIQRFFERVKIKRGPHTSENITAAAKLVARSFEGNSGLPLELNIEIDQLLPETTRRCDWEGLRENILSDWPNDGDQAPSKIDKK